MEGDDSRELGGARRELGPPPVPNWVVSRVDLLLCGHPWDVARIQAPVGYGKTLLASEFARKVEAAWISLIPEWSDAGVFLEVLSHSLRAVWPGIVPAIRATRIAEHDREAASRLWAALLLRSNWVIVLDELQALASGGTAAAWIRSLVEIACRGAGRLVLAGRVLPPELGLSKLAGTGRILDIGPRQLRLRPKEVVRVFADGFGVTIGEDDPFLKTLGGWPACVAMAARYRFDSRAEGDAEPSSLIQNPSLLSEFLAEEVVARLTREEERLLRRTARFRLIDAALGRALGVPKSAEVLRRLSERHLVDRTEERERYRVHPLLREHLTTRAWDGDEEAPSSLAVAEEAARRGEWLLAFDLWLEAGCYDAIVTRLIEWEWTPGSWWATPEWLERLPESLLAKAPNLLYRYASAFAMKGRFELAASCFDRAERLGEVDGSRSLARVAALYYLLRFRQAYVEARALLDTEDLSLRDRWLVHALCLQLSLSEEWKFLEAIEHGRRTVDLAEEIGSPYLMAISHANLACALACAGQMEAAGHSLREGRTAGRAASPYAHALISVAEACCAWLGDQSDAGRPIEEAERACLTQQLLVLAPQMRALRTLWADERGLANVAEPRPKLAPEAASYFGPSLSHLLGAYAALRDGRADLAQELANLAADHVARNGFALGCWPQVLAMLNATGCVERLEDCAKEAVAKGASGGSTLLEFAGRFFLAVSARNGARLEDLAAFMRLARTPGFDQLFAGRWAPIAVGPLNEAVARNVEPEFGRALLVWLGNQAPRVHLFGGLRVEVGNRLIAAADWTRPRTKSVFAYLVFREGDRVPVEELIETFWPEQEVSRARQSLHVVLGQMRRALEPALKAKAPSTFLRFADDTVCLELGEGAWTDVRAFWQLANRALHEKSGTAARCEAALEALRLSSRELLPEYRYEAWNTHEAARVSLCRRDLAMLLAGAAKSKGDWKEVAEFLAPYVEEDPTDECAFRCLAEALCATGRRQVARRLWVRMKSLLKSELGIEPMPETMALARNLGFFV